MGPSSLRMPRMLSRLAAAGVAQLPQTPRMRGPDTRGPISGSTDSVIDGTGAATDGAAKSGRPLMPTLNYTTKIPAERTADEIKAKLAEHGAKRVIIGASEGRLSSIVLHADRGRRT